MLLRFVCILTAHLAWIVGSRLIIYINIIWRPLIRIFNLNNTLVFRTSDNGFQDFYSWLIFFVQNVWSLWCFRKQLFWVQKHEFSNASFGGVCLIHVLWSQRRFGFFWLIICGVLSGERASLSLFLPFFLFSLLDFIIRQIFLRCFRLMSLFALHAIWCFRDTFRVFENRISHPKIDCFKIGFVIFRSTHDWRPRIAYNRWYFHRSFYFDFLFFKAVFLIFERKLSCTCWYTVQRHVSLPILAFCKILEFLILRLFG